MPASDLLGRRDQEREEALAVLAQEVKRLRERLSLEDVEPTPAVKRALKVAAQSPVWREWAGG